VDGVDGELSRGSTGNEVLGGTDYDLSVDGLSGSIGTEALLATKCSVSASRPWTRCYSLRLLVREGGLAHIRKI